HVQSGRAIVVVPSAAVLKTATNLDVLLHFHGGEDNSNVGTNSVERKNPDPTDGKKSVDPKYTHDLHNAKVPQQLAAFAGNVLAITIERTTEDRNDATDGLVDEVFD